jgi:hypothetical protein
MKSEKKGNIQSFSDLELCLTHKYACGRPEREEKGEG